MSTFNANTTKAPLEYALKEPGIQKPEVVLIALVAFSLIFFVLLYRADMKADSELDADDQEQSE